MSDPAHRLFGTDGIRGQAGVYPLTAEAALRLGQAVAEVFLKQNSEAEIHEWPTVVIGKDTRQSGDMLEAAIAAGLNSRGIDVRLAGVIPTPAVAHLTRESGAAFGVVISASHNPFHDNGIKFFGPGGCKLEDSIELKIETAFLEKENSAEDDTGNGSPTIGRIAPFENAVERYVAFVKSTVHDDDQLFSGMKFALDAANGAASQTSAAILKALGAEVVLFHGEPNGMNINRDCGCTHPEVIEQLVRETGADAGISHDGDADRVALCDETGSALDGDELMAIGGLDLLERGELQNGAVVATVMSNAALDVLIESRGGKVVRADVGDRHVIQEMRDGDFNFGGEQSGHLVFRDYNFTGDGILAAVHLLSAMCRSGKPLSELRNVLEKFPQAQRNLPVVKKPLVAEFDALARLIRETEEELGTAGRVLVRYSGTEPLIRVLVEGRDRDFIEAQADAMAEVISEEIGGGKTP